jgi:glucose/arabinose dehydrogenase
VKSPRFFVGIGVVSLVVGLVATSVVLLDRANARSSQGWEDCSAPRVADVPAWDSLGVSEWNGPSLRVEPLAEVEEATSVAETLDGSLLVTAKPGTLHRVASGGATVLLDLTEEILSEGPEQGLTDVAVDRGRNALYLALTDLQGDLEVRAYTLDMDGVPIGSPRLVIRVPQPHEWHQGGDVEVGPDGMVYISFGDGGLIGDPGLNGQDPSTLLSSVIRIDPTREGYDIPEDNPFVGGLFTPGRDEVVAHGLRNPWRMSFDRATGHLWIADVGQNCFEEVNVLTEDAFGANFGWSGMEGSYRFQGAEPADHRLPVFEYAHRDAGCAITGGYVYRGEQIPELRGMYVFADYCRGSIHALELDGMTVTGLVDLGVRIPLLPSFGERSDGELVVLSLERGPGLLVVDE